MENSQTYIILMELLTSIGIEPKTAMVLTVALKNKTEKMDKVVDYIEKNQNLTADHIAREVMKIAMSKTV